MFILYSADIIQCFKNCKYHVYADDVQLYHSFDVGDTPSAVSFINEDLQRIVSWSEQNSLVLNPSKSKYMILGSKSQIAKILSLDPKVTVSGKEIDRVELACSLGLTIDPELRFEAHITKNLRACFYRLKILYSFRQYVSVPIRKLLIDSLVLSKLNYCDTVYGPCLLSRTEKLIQRIQNACARYCFDIPVRGHITPYLNDHNILKMAARRRLHLAVLLFGVISTHEPRYLYEKLDWRSTQYRYGSRATVKPLLTPKYRTAAFRGAFKYAATHCWNDLPPPIRHIVTKHGFINRLKSFLLDSQKLI